MPSLIQIDIVSAETNLYSGQANKVFLTGELGELEITPGHSQLLTSLKPGYVRISLPNQVEEVFYISGGFLEVQPDIITILADVAERAQDLDEMAALAAKREAEERLHDNQSEQHYAEVLAELAQASAQLQAIQQLKQWLK